jgi:hypothetical protein
MRDGVYIGLWDLKCGVGCGFNVHWVLGGI